MNTNLNPITNHNFGIGNAEDWVGQGDSQLAVSRNIRFGFECRRRYLSKTSKSGERIGEPPGGWRLLEGQAQSSVLMAGYAAEMYLKAVLVRSGHYCSSRMLKRDIKHLSHNLVGMAMETHFPFHAGDLNLLRQLELCIINYARYPLDAETRRDHADAFNKRNGFIWSRKIFHRVSRFVKRLGYYARKVDSDTNNVASFNRWEMDVDGYVATRTGGNLPSRITFARSTKQFSDPSFDWRKIREWADPNHHFPLSQIWNQVMIVEDDNKASILRRLPCIPALDDYEEVLEQQE